MKLTEKLNNLFEDENEKFGMAVYNLKKGGDKLEVTLDGGDRYVVYLDKSGYYHWGNKTSKKESDIDITMKGDIESFRRI
jgi:hypothetical protein